VTEWHTGRARTTGQRLTVSQAANALGVTPEAIRGRIRRGTIRVEREAGRVYVVLGADQPRPTTDQPTDRTEQLIATLREQLEAERAAHSESRRLLLEALTKIPPAIEAPGSPETAAEETIEPTPSEPGGGPQRATERPWWRRMFGG
jgi:hypothetical protein